MSHNLFYFQVYRLSAGRIFCEVSRVLAVKQLYGDIRLVLQCIQKSPFSSDILNDEIIMSAIKVLASQTREVGLSCLLLPSIPSASEGWKWVPNSLGMRLGYEAQFLVWSFSCWWKDNNQLLCLPSLQSRQVDKLVQLLTSERSKVKKDRIIERNLVLVDISVIWGTIYIVPHDVFGVNLLKTNLWVATDFLWNNADC